MSIERPTAVNVDGLALNVVDPSGLEWKFISIEGWHDGASVFVEQEQRIGHGQFAQPGRRGGKTLTIKGELRAPDRNLIAAAIDQIEALLADGQFGVFEFIDRTQGSRWTMVQLLGAPTIDWSGGPVAFYQLQLLGPGPYKFGETGTASTGFATVPEGVGLVFPLFPSGALDFGAIGDVGQASVANVGTAAASLKFTISGPAPSGGFIITDTTTGKRIQYLGTLPAGSSLVINGANGSVFIDGTADRLGDTVVDEWPTIPPGQTRTFLFEPIGGTTAAVLTVECVSTYW